MFTFVLLFARGARAMYTVGHRMVSRRRSVPQSNSGTPIHLFHLWELLCMGRGDGVAETPRITFWRAGPFIVRFPGQGVFYEAICARWHCCERLHSALVNFFEDSLNTFARFMMGTFTSTAAQTTLSIQQFLTQNSFTPMPYPPYSPDLTPATFLFPPMKRVLKGKHFADVKKVKEKAAEALKGIQPNEFKNCLSSGKTSR